MRPNRMSLVTELIDRVASPGDSGFLGSLAAVRKSGSESVAVPLLRRVLIERNGDARCKAALALGEFGPVAAAARPELLQATSDADPRLRRLAILALARSGDSSDETKHAFIRGLS